MCEFKCEICGEMVWSIPHHLRSCHRSISPMEYELGVKDDILDFVNKIPNLTKMK